MPDAHLGAGVWREQNATTAGMVVRQRGAGERGGQARQGAEVLSTAAGIPSRGLSWEGQDAGPLVAFGARTARGQEWTLGAGRPLVPQEVVSRPGAGAAGAENRALVSFVAVLPGIEEGPSAPKQRRYVRDLP